MLVGITPVPPHTDITKTAIGATLSVAHEYFPDIERCIQELIKKEYAIIGLEQTSNAQDLTNFSWPQKVAIIVGNEVNGISDKAIPLIHHFIEIPQFGTKHSLNVAVAAGIALWDYVKSAGQKVSR
jgi:tRNA G18 (ribose-2'-O)-methylase SpoU